MARTKDLTVGSPTKLILLYSIPILLGNVFQQFYNMADTIIVGRFLGNDALAGVGLTGSIYFLILGFSLGLTGGFSVVVAQRFGAKDEKGLKHSVAMIIILCAATCVILTAISMLTMRPLLRLMNTPDEVSGYAYDYISVILACMSVTIVYNMVSGLLRAIGDSKTPLYYLFIASILNIGFDLLFIVVFKMGAGGAAWATVMSQAISVVLCLIHIKLKYQILHVSRSDFSLDGKLMWKHVAIGLPMAFQFSITAVGVVAVQGAINLFGPRYIAAYTAASKIEQLVTQPAGTFGVTVATYSGQNLGAGRIDRIRQGVLRANLLTLCFSALASVVLIFGGRSLGSMFLSGDAAEAAAVLDISQIYLHLAAIFFPFLFVIFVFRNCLQGIGHSLVPLLAGFFELVVRLVVSFTLPKMLGFQGICLAGPLAWISAAVPLAIAYWYIMRKISKPMVDYDKIAT
jgi:putative MATE family efflux protein